MKVSLTNYDNDLDLSLEGIGFTLDDVVEAGDQAEIDEKDATADVDQTLEAGTEAFEVIDNLLKLQAGLEAYALDDANRFWVEDAIKEVANVDEMPAADAPAEEKAVVVEKATEGIKDAAIAAWEAIKKFFIWIGQQIAKLWNAFMGLFRTTIRKLQAELVRLKGITGETNKFQQEKITVRTQQPTLAEAVAALTDSLKKFESAKLPKGDKLTAAGVKELGIQADFKKFQGVEKETTLKAAGIGDVAAATRLIEDCIAMMNSATKVGKNVKEIEKAAKEGEREASAIIQKSMSDDKYLRSAEGITAREAATARKQIVNRYVSGIKQFSQLAKNTALRCLMATRKIKAA